LIHHPQETAEGAAGIVGSGRSFRVVLETEDGQGAVPEALHGAVRKVPVGHPQLRGQGGLVHGEAMVLGGDLHLVGVQVEHRLVRPPVAEFQLEGAGPEGLAQQLVAQADAEDGQLADAGRHFPAHAGQRRRVPGPVAKKKPAEAGGGELAGRGVPGEHFQVEA
jgi:hypothetical protein